MWRAIAALLGCLAYTGDVALAQVTQAPLTSSSPLVPPSGCMGKGPGPDPDKAASTLAQACDCAGQLLPQLLIANMAAIAAVDALQRNAPETVAALTGGESFKLTDAKSLERSLASISNHLPNRYNLSFQLQALGLHALSLQLTERPGFPLAARKSYWAIPVQP